MKTALYTQNERMKAEERKRERERKKEREKERERERDRKENKKKQKLCIREFEGKKIKKRIHMYVCMCVQI